MGALDFLFGQVQKAIREHGSPDTPGPSYDTDGILGTLSSIFGQHASQHDVPFNQGQGNVRPASEDPYGDPADQQGGYRQTGGGNFGNVRPASEDPYGDPADQQGGYRQAGGGSFGNVRPASEDPYGDPADQR